MEVAKRYGVFIAAGVLGLVGFGVGNWAIVAWLAAGVLVCAGTVLESPRWGTLATSLLGLACSLYLFGLKIDANGHSICDVSASVSCSAVNATAASMLYGVPIAVLGAGFFLGVALAAGFQAPGSSRLYRVVGALSVVGCFYSLYLGYQALMLGLSCPMCLTIYASNALLLFASYRGASQERCPCSGRWQGRCSPPAR